MDFRAEATIDAVQALIEARLIMFVINADEQSYKYEEYNENRKVVLQAAEKTWHRVRQMWDVAREYPHVMAECESAIMIGFRKAVETRQGHDMSEGDQDATRIVQKFVSSFEPKSLL